MYSFSKIIEKMLRGSQTAIAVTLDCKEEDRHF